MATLGIVLEALRRDLHGAFEHVQLRPDGKRLIQVGAGAHLSRQLGIRLPRGKAGTQQQPPRRITADGLHQLPPQCAQGRGMDEQHALPGQPNAPVVRRKVDQAPQIVVAGQGQGGAPGHPDDYR